MSIEPCLLPDNPLWEVFHLSSRWRAHDLAGIARRAARSGQQPPRDDLFRRFLPVALPGPAGFLLSEMTLAGAVGSRCSARDFAGMPLSWEEIAELLWATAGAVPLRAGESHRRRTFPSAGACYPLELFFWLPVPPAGSSVGPYHYDAGRHSVRCVGGTDADLSLAELVSAAAQPALVERAGLLAVTAAVFARSTWKYGAKGYLFAYIEAGHAVQNTYLAAAALGLGVVAIAGWDDTALDAALGLDGLRASAVYSVAVGRPAAGSS